MNKKMLANKQGQVTLFVIIGLVILIGVALFFVLANNNAEMSIDDFADDIAQVGDGLRPVQLYVQQCLDAVAFQGLVEIGKHGGYIHPLEEQYHNLEYRDVQIYNGDGVLLSSSENTFVPFWMQSITPVKGKSMSVVMTIPSLADIRDDHERYINENLALCLETFSAFTEQGMTVELLEEPDTRVMYTDTQVLVRTELLTQITTAEGNIEQIPNYYVPLDVPFKNYHTKARLITLDAYEYSYLENLPINLFSYYGATDINALPPIYSYQTDGVPVSWPLSQVQQNIEQMLQSYVPLYRFEETKNGQYIDVSDESILLQNFYNSFLLDSFASSNPELDITHVYLAWPIYFNVRDQGQVIEPQQVPSTT